MDMACHPNQPHLRCLCPLLKLLHSVILPPLCSALSTHDVSEINAIWRCIYVGTISSSLHRNSAMNYFLCRMTPLLSPNGCSRRWWAHKQIYISCSEGFQFWRTQREVCGDFWQGFAGPGRSSFYPHQTTCFSLSHLGLFHEAFRKRHKKYSMLSILGECIYKLSIHSSMLNPCLPGTQMTHKKPDDLPPIFYF